MKKENAETRFFIKVMKTDYNFVKRYITVGNIIKKYFFIMKLHINYIESTKEKRKTIHNPIIQR